MFDPLTVAFEIKYPWKGKGRLYRDAIITVWHKDPCSDGSDDSCDWWGHKKTTPQIRALGEAISRLETILDNRPFYPEHEAHLRFQPVKEAYRDMRKRSKFRWPVRWHFWHWRIQFRPWQKFHRWAFERCCFCKRGFAWDESVMGSWSGNSIWHHACNSHTTKSPNALAEIEKLERGGV
jgi:hypothetical protein